MNFSAKQIAEYLDGKIEGDENVCVNTFAKIEEGVKGALSFLSNPKYTPFLYNTESSIVLVNKDLVLESSVKATLIRVDNAYGSLAKLLTLYESMKPKKKGIDSLAYVASSATIGKDVYLAPFAYVGEGAIVSDGAQIYAHAYVGDGARIGDGTILYSNATVYHDCVVGKNCILHSGCVIGADGFGFAPTQKGYEKIPQIGIVVIEDNVEIGANTCIDRATMGRTLISNGVKLDNLIQIAHNDEVGENTVMAAQTGIAGSTKVGKWCMIGGQVGIAGHIKIADQTQIGAQAGIVGTVKKTGQSLWGSPAYNANDCTKSHIITKKLPEMYKQLNDLQKKVDMLLAQINQE